MNKFKIKFDKTLKFEPKTKIILHFSFDSFILHPMKVIGTYEIVVGIQRPMPERRPRAAFALLVGLPGSGKTTFSKQWAEKSEHYTVVRIVFDENISINSTIPKYVCSSFIHILLVERTEVKRI